MTLLRIDKLEEGMKVKNDVIAPSGRFILSAGSFVEDKHIRIFKSWGVVEVRVEGEVPPETLSNISPLSASNMIKVLAYVDHLFSLCGTGTPVLKELRRIATVRIIKKISDSDAEDFIDVCSRLEHINDISPTGSGKSISEIINKELNLSSFLNVYIKIREILKNPLSSSSDIARAIEKDPIVSLKILKVANSTYYGVSTEISTIERAVTVLGGRKITSIVAGISAIQCFDKMPQDIVNIKSFWLNSISCGVFARFIADEIHMPDGEELFLSGLLKNIGFLLALKNSPVELKIAIQKVNIEKKALETCEKELLGFSHADLGAAFLSKYDFPASIIDAVKYGDNPMLSQSPLEVSVVHLANVLSFVVTNGWSRRLPVPELCYDAWKKLNISHNVLETLVTRAERQINEISVAFLE